MKNKKKNKKEEKKKKESMALIYINVLLCENEYYIQVLGDK